MQKIDDIGLCFEVGEQRPYPLEVVVGVNIAEKIGLPADDELLARAGLPRPGGEARVDQARRDLVELLARFQPRGLDLGARLGKRASAYARVDEIAGFLE